jgi:hypothetical protein
VERRINKVEVDQYLRYIKNTSFIWNYINMYLHTHKKTYIYIYIYIYIYLCT